MPAERTGRRYFQSRLRVHKKHSGRRNGPGGVCRAAEQQARDSLRNGMCALCGCFVEVRAAKKRQHCAQSEKIW
ncbi:MAG: DUF6171 family protein [Eubacteriales bacterium]